MLTALHRSLRALPTRLGEVALFAALAAGAAGCAVGSQRYGRVIDAQQITAIKPGVSTKQDVLDTFGPPTDYSRIAGSRLLRAGVEFVGPQDAGGDAPLASGGGDEEVFTYEYREDNERFFTLLLFTYFRRDVIADRLMVFFHDNDVVKYLAFVKQTDAEPEEEAEGEEPDAAQGD